MFRALLEKLQESEKWEERLHQGKTYLVFKRVSYGKATTPTDKREYQLYPGAPVGTLSEIVDWYRKNHLEEQYDGVILRDGQEEKYIDLDFPVEEGKVKEGRGEDIYQRALDMAKASILDQIKHTHTYDEISLRDMLMTEYSLSKEEAEGIIYDAAGHDELDLGEQPVFDRKQGKANFSEMASELMQVGMTGYQN